MDDIIVINNNSFPTLVAIDPEEQARGLMHRKWPPPVMCFPFYTCGTHKFWMKNTISPLDIIFCRGNKIVDICYGEPMSTKLVGPEVPTDLVIELPHGTVAQCGILKGHEVSMQFSRLTIARDIRGILGRIFK